MKRFEDMFLIILLVTTIFYVVYRVAFNEFNKPMPAIHSDAISLPHPTSK